MWLVNKNHTKQFFPEQNRNQLFFISVFIIHPKTHSKGLENLQTFFLSYTTKSSPVPSLSFASFAVFFGSF